MSIRINYSQNDCRKQIFLLYINARENRRGDQEWTIQRHKQHLAEDTERRQTTQKPKR